VVHYYQYHPERVQHQERVVRVKRVKKEVVSSERLKVGFHLIKKTKLKKLKKLKVKRNWIIKYNNIELTIVNIIFFSFQKY